MNQKGITIIELVTVMVIVAIGAVLAAPNMGAWLTNYRLRGATRDIVSTMRLAQVRAVSNNIQYGVAFDSNSREYQIYYQTTGGLLPEGAINQLPNGVQFNNIALPIDPTLNKPFSRFYANSTAVNGSIVLANTKGITKVIQLLGITGRVKIE